METQVKDVGLTLEESMLRGIELRDNLKPFRTAKGWGQWKVADKLGVTQRQVSRWESGEVIPNEESQDKLISLYEGRRVITEKEKQELLFEYTLRTMNMVEKIFQKMGLEENT